MAARNKVPAEGSGADAAMLEALGHRLREMRRARGMTQASVVEEWRAFTSAARAGKLAS